MSQDDPERVIMTRSTLAEELEVQWRAGRISTLREIFWLFVFVLTLGPMAGLAIGWFLWVM